MRHVLAPTGEDPAGKGVLEGDQGMVAEADIDNVSKFLSCFKRFTWYKEEGVVGPVVQNLGVLVVLNPIELYVRVVERKSSSKFPRPVTKNCCVWSVSKNRAIIKNGKKNE
jgi:hypothetical protein